MLGFNGFGIRPETDWQISREAVAFLLLAIVVTIAEPFGGRIGAAITGWIQRITSGGTVEVTADGAAVMTATTTDWVAIARSTALILLTAAALMKLAEQSYSPFLYFQF